MSAIDELLERKRQKLTGDDWYTQSRPYALQLFMPVTEEPLGQAVFVFPLGPEELRVSRVFRQSVTATLGGVIAEERGIAWRDITVSGTFGLGPKRGFDTTLRTESGFFAAIAGADRLSGPMWTMRMLRHFFDRYAALKADPATAAKTYMVWHDFRTSDSFVVVPQAVELNRSVGKRLMYPFSLSLKAIAPADTLVLPDDELGKLAEFFARLKSIVANVAQNLAVLQAAFDEATAFVGEVRYFVSTVDALFTQVDSIARAAQAFVDGTTDTIAAGRQLLDDVASSLDDVLAALDSSTPNAAGIVASDVVPQAVVQQFRSMQDGIHGMLSQRAAFGSTYKAKTDSLKSGGSGTSAVSDEELDEAEAAGPGSTGTTKAADKALKAAGALPTGREYRDYQGHFPYTVLGGDTIQGIAAKFLGGGFYYYDIAVLNDLKPPYISWAGGPNVARPGDTISVPSLTPQRTTNSPDLGLTSEAAFGRDFRLRETKSSRPGRPGVDLRLDKTTNRDLATVGGIDNLVQATQMRMWTTRRTMPHFPGYGLPQVVGLKNDAANVTMLKIAIRNTLRQDSRIDRVLSMQATIEADILDFELSVLPVGTTDQTTINTALV